MRLLLLNNNPAVSRLIKLSAEKAGYDLAEFEDYGLVPLSDYDVILADNEVADESELKSLCERTGCQYIIYICQRGAQKPDYANIALEKPFLPTDFLTMLDQAKHMISTQHQDTHIDLDSESVDESHHSFDIDKIDEEDDLMPFDSINLDGDEAAEKSLDLHSIDLDHEDVSFMDHEDTSEAKSDDVPTMLSLEEELESNDTEFDSKELEDFDFEGLDDLTEEISSKDDEEQEEMLDIAPSVLDKDDIDEVKQLLDENDDESIADTPAFSMDDFNLDDETETEDESLKLDPIDTLENDETLDMDTTLDASLDDAFGFDQKDDLVLNNLDDDINFDLDTPLDLEASLATDENEISEDDTLLGDEALSLDALDEEADESLEEPVTQEELIEDFEEELVIPDPQKEISFDALESNLEIDSLDGLSENILKRAFGEEVTEEDEAAPVAKINMPSEILAPVAHEKSENIEVIKDEIETSIAKSISALAQSDILREALKGMRINISITFDDKEGL